MKTILVVDDDERWLFAVEKLLTKEGYIVHVARDGKEAMHSIKRHQPDLALLDLEMPVMNGREFLHARTVGLALAKTPVIVVSASDECFGLPLAQTVVAKPVDFRELLAQIHTKIGKP